MGLRSVRASGCSQNETRAACISSRRRGIWPEKHRQVRRCETVYLMMRNCQVVEAGSAATVPGLIIPTTTVPAALTRAYEIA